MYRQQRNTLEWLIDSQLSETLGPGSYATIAPLQHSPFQKTTSFNFGNVPFGSGKPRFIDG